MTEQEIKELQEKLALMEAEKIAREEAEVARLEEIKKLNEEKEENDRKMADKLSKIEEEKRIQDEKLERLLKEMGNGTDPADILKKQKDAEAKRKREELATKAREEAEKERLALEESLAESRRIAKEANDRVEEMALKNEIKDLMLTKPHIAEDLGKIKFEEGITIDEIKRKKEFILEFKDTEKEIARYELEKNEGTNAFGKTKTVKKQTQDEEDKVKADLEAYLNR